MTLASRWPLLAVVLLLAPLALADHVYTHRYYVSGRLLDAANEPVSGASVAANLPGTTIGPCAGYEGPANAFHATRTSPEGDFQICFHAHAFEPGQRVALNLSGDSFTVPADAELRRTVVLHRMTEESPRKDAGAVQFFPFRYAVTGRAWNASGPVLLENVPGNGTPLADAEITATLAAPGMERVSRTVRSDTYGDYAVTFQLGREIVNGTLRVATGNVVESTDVDPVFRRSVVNLYEKPAEIPEGIVPPTPPPSFGPAPGEARPGTSTPAPGVLVALAALAACALVGRRARAGR